MPLLDSREGPSYARSMEGLNLVEVVPSLALGIGLAACAGIRAWLPLLLVGGLARWGVISLAPSFQFISGNRGLLLFGVAPIVEVAGTRLPSVGSGRVG